MNVFFIIMLCVGRRMRKWWCKGFGGEVFGKCGASEIASGRTPPALRLAVTKIGVEAL